MPYDFDLLVVGGGPAGETAAITASTGGRRVALVERAPEPGGAAVHTGTLPSKTLREAALFLSGYRQRTLYCMDETRLGADALDHLRKRKDAVRDSEVGRIHWDLSHRDIRVLRGHARFVDPHAVDIATGGTRLRISFDKALIATGSVPFRPANIPFEDPDIDDSDSILWLDRLPHTLTVLGAGVIGCEYASMFAAMGVRVTLVEARDRLLPFLDSEIAERLRIVLGRGGIELLLSSPFTAVARRGDTIVTTLADGRELRADRLLYTAGRQGNTSDLALENAGLTADKRGALRVNPQGQTDVPHIYAAGDVVGFPALASTSMEQGRVAARHAFGVHDSDTIPSMLPYGIYTIPEVSTVGETEESCRAKGIEYGVGRALYRNNPRGKIVGDTDGLVKLIFRADETHRLLGVHILGARASELVHLGQLALQTGSRVEAFTEMVFNYPTLSSCYQAAAYDGLARLERTSRPTGIPG